MLKNIIVRMVLIMGIKLSDFISEDFEFTDEEIYNTYLQAGFDVELSPDFEYLQNPFTTELLKPIVIETTIDNAEVHMLTEEQLIFINNDSKDIMRWLTQKEKKSINDNVYNTSKKNSIFINNSKNSYDWAA